MISAALLDQIEKKLQPLWPRLQVEQLECVDSTNSHLLRALKSQKAYPRLVTASKQTAGRGRIGKTWDTAAGQSLIFSLAIPIPSLQIGAMALVVGCAIIQALKTSSPEQNATFKIKWPNDIWINCDQRAEPHWKKLAGILIETLTASSQKYAIIGVGVNVDTPPNAHTHRTPPGCLKELDSNWTLEQAFESVVPEVAQAVHRFIQEGFTPFQPLFEQHDLLRGQKLQTTHGISGIGAGIDAEGQLLIQTPKGIIAIQSGEIGIQSC